MCYICYMYILRHCTDTHPKLFFPKQFVHFKRQKTIAFKLILDKTDNLVSAMFARFARQKAHNTNLLLVTLYITINYVMLEFFSFIHVYYSVLIALNRTVH